MRCWWGGLVGNGGANSLGRYEYIWLPTEDGGAMPIGLYKDGKFFAVHADHLGTPRLMTDNSNKPIWQWPYSAFGESSPTGVLALTSNTNLIYTQDPTSLNRLKLTTPGVVYNLRHEGQYADSETGLFYNYFRTYDPKTGRYSQNDPIGLGGGLNRFGYVGGNALSHKDSKGLITDCEMSALREIVNKYGMGGATESNFCTDPTLEGAAGKTNIFGKTVIGTNPAEGRLQYSGSVIENGLSFNVINTALHENVHQAEAYLTLGVVLGFDAAAEVLTGGSYSLAQTVADRVMSKNPGIEKDFMQKVTSCLAGC